MTTAIFGARLFTVTGSPTNMGRGPHITVIAIAGAQLTDNEYRQ